IEDEWSGPSRTYEPLPIDQETAAPRKPLEQLAVEVATEKWRNVEPLDRSQHGLRDVSTPERLADGVDLHRARTALVVAEGERGGLAARRDRHRQAEGCQSSLKVDPVGLSAFREHHRVMAECAECTRCVPRPPADPRRGACDDVTREWSDYAE